MEEARVNFKVAQLLKEAGFDEQCRAFYLDWNGFLPLIDCDHHQSFDYCTNSSLEAYNSDEECHVAAPTQQMALAWIRKKGYYIQINFVPYNGRTVYDWKIYDKSHECIAVLPDTLDYYEECVNNALEFVLFYILDTVKLASE